MMSLTNGRLPKYQQLAQQLRQQIEQGKLPPNGTFPTEASLCAQYGVSRGTVQQAIRQLVLAGLVRREQGRGTFVNPLPQPDPTFFTLTSFDEEMRRRQRQPSTQLLCAEVVPATPTVADRLAIAPAAPVIHIERLRLADEQPVAHEIRYLAQALCPSLLDHDLAMDSIHWLLVHHYHIPLVCLKHTVEIQPLTAVAAALLQVATGTTAFAVDRLTFTQTAAGERQTAVWYQAVYREDIYDLRLKRD